MKKSQKAKAEIIFEISSNEFVNNFEVSQQNFIFVERELSEFEFANLKPKQKSIL